MSPPPFAPDEPLDVILGEVMWLQGAFLGSLFCGAQITLSIVTFLAVLKQRMRRRPRNALLVYIFVLCAIMTAGQEVSLLFVQMGFIQLRNYPGGPNGYLSYQYSSPASLASTTLFMFGSWMIESLLVWRCKVVCSTSEQPTWIGVAIPCVFLASEYATGSIFLFRMLRGAYMVNLGIAYSALSLLLNVTVTGIIAGRLLIHRRRIVRQFGPGHGSPYAGAAAILIESASLYTFLLILIIIFFSVPSPASNLLQQIAAQVQCITSLLIIYRIAKGKGRNNNAIVSSVEWRRDVDTDIQTCVVDGIVHIAESVPDAARAEVIQAPCALNKQETPTSPVATTPIQGYAAC